MPRMLAIECATAACSVALFEGGELVDSRHEVLGRGHAERLVPMIAELPGRGRADRILVSLGPGSFTGVRIGLAAARALGLVWGAEVLGYPTLALVAAMSMDAGDVGKPRGVLVCMAGGHGEWFLQPFDHASKPVGSLRSLSPEQAVREYDHEVVGGSRAREFVALRGSGRAHEILPDARSIMEVSRTLLTSKLAPIYGRPPDARLPGELR